MIHENSTYGKHENVTIIEFGNGDINMTKATRDGDIYKEGMSLTELMFISDTPHPIGHTHDDYKGMTSDEVPRPSVVMVFNKPESITALIHSLIEMQKTMFPVKAQIDLENIPSTSEMMDGDY